MVSGQLPPSDWSFDVTNPLPSQLSIQNILLPLGTSPIHCVVISAGAEDVKTGADKS